MTRARVVARVGSALVWQGTLLLVGDPVQVNGAFVREMVEEVECLLCCWSPLLASKDEVHPLAQVVADVIRLECLMRRRKAPSEGNVESEGGPSCEGDKRASSGAMLLLTTLRCVPAGASRQSRTRQPPMAGAPPLPERSRPVDPRAGCCCCFAGSPVGRRTRG